MSHRLAVFAVAAALASACRGLPASVPASAPAPATLSASPDGGQRAAAQESAAVAAAMRQSASAVREYKISPADLVSVTVYDVQGMDRRARVDAKGRIFLPLVGGVRVGGKTLGAAQMLIEKKLSAYVVRPQVSLFIEEYGNKLYFVMGEVQKPGSYSIPTESQMTVLQAISTAGGFTPVAARDRARVLRYVDGQSVSLSVDMKSITGEGQMDQDLVLKPNDVVYVPQSFF